MQGLYHKNSGSPKRERLWWSMYHGDRFMSMLLGLPYGINDAHYGFKPDGFSLRWARVSAAKIHTFQCALIAGKLIDRNLMSSKPSLWQHRGPRRAIGCDCRFHATRVVGYTDRNPWSWAWAQSDQGTSAPANFIFFISRLTSICHF